MRPAEQEVGQVRVTPLDTLAIFLPGLDSVFLESR